MLMRIFARPFLRRQRITKNLNMLKPFLLTMALLCLGFSITRAQSTVSGSLVDTSSQRKVSNAVVALIGVKDSLLYRFVRSDANGKFSIPGVRSDSFVIQVSHPDYADYIDYLKPQPGKDLGIGNLFITQKSKLLEEVIVRQNMAIRIKGDTIEYKADSFKTQEGASVKDLLKKFPGITVDRNGKITAQGQDVAKVLVDGEEFFSDDPAVVIENLRADAIDKVQSFDKKSDQSEFTGVDDGSRSKTLNLVLKEDKKKGMIGKVVLGAGTEERYSNQAMLNFFKGKQKIAVYGIISNTGVTGLGWNDRGTFSQGFDLEDAEIMPGGGLMITSSDDGEFGDWDNQYQDEGIPQTIKAGAHYSNKLNQDKTKVNANYTFKDMNVNAVGNTLTKYTLPESSYYNRERHDSKSSQNEHNFNALYDVKLDSLASLRFKFNGKLGTQEAETNSLVETLDNDLGLVNSNRRAVSTRTENEAYLGSVLWRQRLKKKGRTISVSASYKMRETQHDGNLGSIIDYYQGGGINRSDTIDQKRDFYSESKTATARAVYTEPMGKKGTLEFNYAFSRTRSESDRKTFDADDTGKYTSLNDSLSIRYGLAYISNGVGVKYQYSTKKLSANIGTNVGASSMNQFDSLNKKVRTFRFLNLNPSARVSYAFAPQRRMSFNYYGGPNPPSIDQLQPIRDNSDPLFVVVGNPNLKQSFSHSLNLDFSDFKTLTGRNIYASVRFNPQQNAIVTDNTIDASGKTTQRYRNSQGNYSMSGFFDYGIKIKEFRIGMGINGSNSRYVNILNGVMNRNTQSNIGVGPAFSTFKEEKYEVWARANYGYNFSNSNNQSLNANFFSQDYEMSGTWFFSKRFFIGSSVNATLRQKTDAFQGNNNITVWNADVNYKVFKKKNGVFRFEMFDMLNQRRGYQRNFSGTSVSERNYNTLSRYGMLTFTWNFVKNPTPAPSK
ncbi:MAG: hypothetical protein EOO09_11225 [Chitinophagaceae bacterium]|nr:MAG: hypothetical protein EOO09_11225 [Chitinophagaceae bacterium]